MILEILQNALQHLDESVETGFIFSLVVRVMAEMDHAGVFGSNRLVVSSSEFQKDLPA